VIANMITSSVCTTESACRSSVNAAIIRGHALAYAR